jgi:hypothetical protein
LATQLFLWLEEFPVIPTGSDGAVQGVSLDLTRNPSAKLEVHFWVTAISELMGEGQNIQQLAPVELAVFTQWFSHKGSTPRWPSGIVTRNL